MQCSRKQSWLHKDLIFITSYLLEPRLSEKLHKDVLVRKKEKVEKKNLWYNQLEINHMVYFLNILRVITTLLIVRSRLFWSNQGHDSLNINKYKMHWRLLCHIPQLDTLSSVCFLSLYNRASPSVSPPVISTLVRDCHCNKSKCIGPGP